MTIQAQGYAAKSKSQTLEPFTYDLPDIKPNHIRVNVTHCGLCHTDVHVMEDDLGITTFPVVPGHEVIGFVEAIGDSVENFSIGQRVGIGFLSSSCGTCKQCQQSEENLCSSVEVLILHSKGGFSDKVDVDVRFAYDIPKELTSENAAPLLCAGIAVYAPLNRHIKRTGMTVAIVGIGGLGHLGLQFAKAMGAKVIAISHCDSKKDEALKFGADKFVNSSNANELTEVAGDIDLIIDTVSASHNFSTLFDALAPNGTLCVIGLTQEELKFLPTQFILTQKSVTGSNVGSPQEILDMLSFSAKYGIKTQTEVMPMSQVNEAIERLLANKARYRIVLETGQ